MRFSATPDELPDLEQLERLPNLERLQLERVGPLPRCLPRMAQLQALSLRGDSDLEFVQYGENEDGEAAVNPAVLRDVLQQLTQLTR